MYKILENGITFSDVLLVPNYSEIQSREFVNTSVQIKDVIFNHPIVPANMKSVMSYDMAKAIVNSGGLCIYHRFCSDNDQLNIFLKLRTDFGEGKIKYSPYNHFAISVGTKDVNYLNVQRFIQEGGRFVCIDIAHGDSSNCIETIKDLRNWFGDKIIIIAGNIATSGGAKRLWDAGVDVVKCGIGSGSICSTRTNTGNGVPQLSALIDVYTCLTENKITDKYIIADGGITNSGDIMKALCFSHMIMSGGLFSACDESSGELIDGEDIGLIPGVKYKSHNGSSTHKTTYVEGAKTFVKSNGKYNVVLSTLLQGVRSGCSYQGVNNLVDLREAPVFIKISSSSLKESGIHGVDKVV